MNYSQNILYLIYSHLHTMILIITYRSYLFRLLLLYILCSVNFPENRSSSIAAYNFKFRARLSRLRLVYGYCHIQVIATSSALDYNRQQCPSYLFKFFIRQANHSTWVVWSLSIFVLISRYGINCCRVGRDKMMRWCVIYE